MAKTYTIVVEPKAMWRFKKSTSNLPKWKGQANWFHPEAGPWVVGDVLTFVYEGKVFAKGEVVKIWSGNEKDGHKVRFRLGPIDGV